MTSEIKIFKGVKYLLAGDQNNDALKQCLKENGALREFYFSDLVTHVVSETCQFSQFKQVRESGTPIVNANWVHLSIKCGAMMPPKPFSPKTDVLFHGMTFCPSQIPMKDRDNLLAMILYYGGRYETTFTPACTHLIAGKPHGKKYDLALTHKIKVVTPDWLTDCIVGNKIHSENDYAPSTPIQSPRFQAPDKMVGSDGNSNKLPPAEIPVDLLKGVVLFFAGYKEKLQAGVFESWNDVVKQASGKVASSYSDDVTHFICLHQQVSLFKKALAERKRIATAYWLNDILEAKRMFLPTTPLHLPAPFTEVITGMHAHLITISGYEGKDRSLVKHMIDFLGARYTGHMTRAHTLLISKTKSGMKYKRAMEWGIPVVSAKWLGDMLQTGQSFPTKVKTKYSAIGLPDELQINATFSRHITDIWREDTEKESLDDSNGPPPAKARKFEQAEVKRVLFTGLTGATVHRLRQSVLKMKGELARGVNDCTHLVAPKITRTVKFLSAVSICKFLVAPAWVDESFEAKQFLDESTYTLVDPESEELFGFKLRRSLQRAQTRKVCTGLHFHVTPSILPAPNAMREIIECAGGKMTEISTLEDVENIFIENTTKDHSYNSYLVSCMDDKKLWNELVKDGHDVYNVELILSGVMKQELEWNLHHL